jgi:outer membrane receptor protein involved in Fe transport
LFPARGICAAVMPVLASVPTPVFAQQITFNVAEQPAVTGIPDFARQAGIQIVSPVGMDGLKTRAVRGRHSVDDGLKRLLRGTNLYMIFRAENIISLAMKSSGVRPPAKLKPPKADPRTKAAISPNPDTEADIIVTGTTAPVRRLDAGLAITTASLEQIHELAPNNTADLLKLVPGIWAETTGGATGANVFVRGFPTTGDAPFLTVQLDGAPIYPPTELTFSENTTLFRVDDMIDRVEILRGGTSPIFSNGQPGAIMNFIQRTGTPNFGGGLRLTTTDYGTRRADAYLTGPLAPDTVFAVGGFYRTSDGLRNTQFLADRGGQITANITHHFSDAVVTAYVRYTRDRNAFYTGVPLLADGGGRYSALPGFDPLNDTLIGRDTQHLSIETGPAAFSPVNLDEGRGLKLFLGGTSFEWRPSDRIKVSNRLNVTSGSADTIGLFTGPTPETLGQYISETVSRANSDPRVVAVAGTASSGQATVSATGTPLSLDRTVLTAGLWSVTERIRAITDELRVSDTLGGGNKVTGGLYFSHYRADAVDLLGNNLLLLAEPNARRVDLVLNNGVRATHNGFVSATTSQIVDTSESTNIAAFLEDEWSVTPRIGIDAGIRFEHQALRGSLRNVQANVDFDGNPLTLYDNNGALLLPSSTPVNNDANRASLSAGMIYKLIPDRLTLHARFNHGSNLPSFDKLRLGGPQHQSANVFEAGADLATGPVHASVNAFVNHFTGLQFTRLLEEPDGTVGNIILEGGANAAGVEVETDIRPTRSLEIELRGTYEDGRYRGFGDNSGNQVVRQPRLQFALSPAYTTHFGRAEVKLRTTYTYVGKRFSDVENLQPLPTYSTLDASLHVELPNGLYADIVAQNLTDTIALTEGNTRVIGAVLSSGPIIARPLFSRNITASVGYRF